RLKLDQCGIKLKLHQWLRFSREARQNLIEHPCETAAERATYRRDLINLIAAVCQEQASELAVEPTPAWEDATVIPAVVLEQAIAKGVSLEPVLWQCLTPLQRFALIKLSCSRHENSNFVPALQEFPKPKTQVAAAIMRAQARHAS
ncbi:MAG: nitrate reductase maturation protein NarM, partial [Synechococcaceae cyanobacterium SM2_3_60]|nr:nitrate reductase maturation protein NarM [Synechococcaceae cyanobacterium SM2_3_60]